MKSIFTIILTFAIFLSCSKKKEKVNQVIIVNEVIESEIKPELDKKIALKFINDYCEFCNNKLKKQSTITTENWIKKNDLLTERFKKSYKNIVETAEKEDPDLGLDFDPIFDAQDFPQNGFEFISIENNEYITVKAKGKGWTNFLLKMKLINFGNKCLVDGSGFVNMPDNKRIKDN